MAKYIILGQWTEQGIRNVKNSPKRVEAVKAIAAKVRWEDRRVVHDGQVRLRRDGGGAE